MLFMSYLGSVEQTANAMYLFRPFRPQQFHKPTIGNWSIFLPDMDMILETKVLANDTEPLNCFIANTQVLIVMLRKFLYIELCCVKLSITIMMVDIFTKIIAIYNLISRCTIVYMYAESIYGRKFRIQVWWLQSGNSRTTDSSDKQIEPGFPPYESILE